MKLIDILTERKYSTPTIAYHATVARNLRSILKHGLIPNKSNSGYGSGETSSAGYSLSALPGIYFTFSSNDATWIAKSFGHHPIIIIAQIQANNVEADEDNITHIIDEWKIKHDVWKLIEDNEANINVEELAHDYTIKTLEKDELSDLDTRARANVEPLLYDYLVKLITFIKDGGDEAPLKQMQHKLTIALKNVAKRNRNMSIDRTTSARRFKYNRPLTFSGSNKIVGIYFYDDRSGWGNLGDYEEEVLHKYKTPSELITSKQFN